MLVFGLAGLGCSALLPLTISFGQRDLADGRRRAAGLLIALYQVGYGIAAFGFGPLQDLLGVGLAAIFGLAAVVAVGMGSLSFVIVRRAMASDAVAVAAAQSARLIGSTADAGNQACRRTEMMLKGKAAIVTGATAGSATRSAWSWRARARR